MSHNLFHPVRLFTVADLAALPSDVPSGSVRYELDDGRLVILSPHTDVHGRSQARVCAVLLRQGEERGLGVALATVGVILRRNPDRVVAPDAAFILTASLPAARSPEGYLETIPELVVEVGSKNDTNPEVFAKCEEYFRAGVQVAWVIDPDARSVAAHNADGSVQIFRDGESLTCGLLPSFAVPVATLFAGT